MSRQIYVNLPIRSMERRKAFFSALGFSFNPQFTGEQGACMVVADNIYAMRQRLKVVATCSFIAKFIQGHPEYQDLLVGQNPG